jgi:hypothetical protein
MIDVQTELLGLALESRAAQLLRKAVSLLPEDEREELIRLVTEAEKTITPETRQELRRFTHRR